MAVPIETTAACCSWLNVPKYQLHDRAQISNLRQTLEHDGVVTLPDFLPRRVLEELVSEAKTQSHAAYFATSTHNVFLTPIDGALPATHVHNRQVNSSKGCVTTEQIPTGSILHDIYRSLPFRRFLASVLGADGLRLYPYEDPLSSINVHYYTEAGQELGWHFDNSSFAITLLLQSPDGGGGVFEYVPNLRDSSVGGEMGMNYEGVGRVLDGGRDGVRALDIRPGTLVIFRGRDSLHRVTPTKGDRARILVVLAYNDKEGVSLSEEARLTFFGRTGT